MAVSLVLAGREYIDSLRNRLQNEELRKIKADKENQENRETVPAGKTTKEKQKNSKKPEIMEKYRILHDKNKDIAGWLTIEGTGIDYPVMQCTDDEFYLHHDFYGKKSPHGCLFVKKQADLTSGTNFIIYGHSMKDGSMFGDLDLYETEEFYKQHSFITFDTLYKERTYKILSVFRTQVDSAKNDTFKYYQFYKADTKKQFDNFYQNIKNLSLYNTKVKAKFGDTFLTLSTCSYHTDNGRFVVVAKKVKK